MKKCTYCAEEIQDEAIKCKHCGERLDTQNEEREKSSGLGVLGKLAFIAGSIILIYYWQFYDTSVAVPTETIFGQTVGGGRVNNLGLMQDRESGIIVGGIIAAFGLFCLISSGRNRRVSAAAAPNIQVAGPAAEREPTLKTRQSTSDKKQKRSQLRLLLILAIIGIFLLSVLFGMWLRQRIR